MKTLTIVSTIFMALSLIAGIYGMNFKYMPETEWRYGYFVVVSMMFILAVILFVFFRRRKWL
jgi:magnesium transporter